MFFQSWRSLILAILLIGIGCIQLFYSREYADAAKREVSTVGRLTYVSRGKSSTFEYSFEVNGFTTGSISGKCRTALTPQGCKEGAQVIVYYDPEHRSPPMLEEFGAASRERLFFGSLMVICGFLLIGFYFILKRVVGDPEESEETDESKNNDEPDVLHIVPGK